MAYTDYLHLTTEELETIRNDALSAKTKLLTGSMAESFTIDGNQVSYSRIDIPQLNILISDVVQARNELVGGSEEALASFVIVSGGKGL